MSFLRVCAFLFECYFDEGIPLVAKWDTFSGHRSENRQRHHHRKIQYLPNFITLSEKKSDREGFSWDVFVLLYILGAE